LGVQSHALHVVSRLERRFFRWAAQRIARFKLHRYCRKTAQFSGGFGVDNVSFTGSALGAVGYRTTLFGVPSTVQAGYKALTVNVDKPIVAADVTLHGPFIGLTGYW